MADQFNAVLEDVESLTRRGRMTLEHVTTLARGGTHDPSNVALACRACNAFKQYLSRDEFRLLPQWMLEERLTASSAG